MLKCNAKENLIEGFLKVAVKPLYNNLFEVYDENKMLQWLFEQ